MGFGGSDDALDSFGKVGRWRSMACTTFADDTGEPSKRKAAWGSPRLSMMESNDPIDGQGGMLGGRSKSGEDGKEGPGGVFLHAWVSNPCTVTQKTGSYLVDKILQGQLWPRAQS